MNRKYIQEMWGFQSALFFFDQQRISGVDELDEAKWFNWVADRGRAFQEHYKNVLSPFSESGVTLDVLPDWADGSIQFDQVDSFIDDTWGYSAASLRNAVEQLEYKALVVHVVYASSTSSMETKH